MTGSTLELIASLVIVAGAELQRLGKFIEYNDEDDSDV